MASPRGVAADDQTFPAADVQAELHPDRNRDFKVDPASSEAEDQANVIRKKEERERKDALQTLKTTIIVSTAIMALAGAVFVITKKLKEK